MKLPYVDTRKPNWMIPALIGVIAILAVVTTKSLMGNAARVAEAESAKAEAVTSDSLLAVALDAVTVATDARVATEADTVRLSGLLEAARDSAGQIRRESELENARLRERLSALAAARTKSASGLRADMPEALQAPFDEHEQIHAAELAASEKSHEQTKRTLTAARAFSAQQDSAIVGLRSLVMTVSLERNKEHDAMMAAIISRDRWKASSDKWEAVSNRGLLTRIFQDVETYVGAVGVGYGIAKFAGG